MVTIRALSSEKKCKDFLGISIQFFNQVLAGIESKMTERRALSHRDQLVIFYHKLKSGTTFTSISVIFDVCEKTVSKVFIELVHVIHDFCKKMVFWLSKQEIMATMPESFKIHYPNTRVTIGK